MNGPKELFLTDSFPIMHVKYTSFQINSLIPYYFFLTDIQYVFSEY